MAGREAGAGNRRDLQAEDIPAHRAAVGHGVRRTGGTSGGRGGHVGYGFPATEVVSVLADTRDVLYGSLRRVIQGYRRSIVLEFSGHGLGIVTQ